MTADFLPGDKAAIGCDGSGELLRDLKSALKGGFESLEVCPTGKVFATAGVDKLVRIWGIEKLDLEDTLAGHSRQVRALAWSPDGQRLASGGDDCKIIISSMKGVKEKK